MSFDGPMDHHFINHSVTTDESGIETGNAPGTEPCIVCGADARGLHFQVVSCRACAAFFRRSVRNKRVYRCRTGFRDCDLTKTASGKPICRFCRLNKCYNVGMRLDVDDSSPGDCSPPIITSSMASVSLSQQEGVPSSSSEPSPPMIAAIERPIRRNRVIRDFNNTIESVKSILRSTVARHIPGIPVDVHQTPMQQIQYAFSGFRSHVCPSEPLEPVALYDKLTFYPFMEKYCQHVADMFMSCRPFVSLPFEDKYKLFKSAWPLIHSLERMYSTTVLYGHDLDDSRQVFTDTISIDSQKTGVYATDIDATSFQELMKFCFPLKEMLHRTMLTPIKQMHLTHTEFSYIIIYLMFNIYENRDLSPTTIQLGEQLLDQFSTELHVYYTYDMKMPNYAARIARILKLIAAAKQHSMHIKDYMIMAKVFDIYVCNFYECELFE